MTCMGDREFGIDVRQFHIKMATNSIHALQNLISGLEQKLTTYISFCSGGEERQKILN